MVHQLPHDVGDRRRPNALSGCNGFSNRGCRNASLRADMVCGFALSSGGSANIGFKGESLVQP